MPTARARMLELSPLPSGAQARTHFLAIVLGTGGGPCPETDLDAGRLWLSPAAGFLITTDAPGYIVQGAPPLTNAGFVVESEKVGYFIATGAPGYNIMPNQEAARLLDEL